MKINIISVILLFLLNSSYGQKDVEKYTPSKKIAKHWVWAPFYFIPIGINSQRSADDTKIPSYNDGGLTIGIKTETSHPNYWLEYGSELGYSLLNYSLFKDKGYTMTNHAVFLTPYLSFKINNDVFSTSRKIISVGFSNSYVIKNNTYYWNKTLKNESNLKALNKYQLYLYAGIGLKKDLFIANVNTEQSELSLGFYLPVFSRANIFVGKKSSFQGELEKFHNSKGFWGYATLRWSQMLDFHSNLYKDSLDLIGKPSKPKYFPALIHFDNATTNSFGGFYVESRFRQKQDSIYKAEDNTTIYNLRESNTWALGYTFHFLGNQDHNRSSFNNDRGFRRNVFGSAGVSKTNYLLNSTSGIAKINTYNVDAMIGGRIGIEKGLYLNLAYGVSFPFKKEFTNYEIKKDIKSYNNIQFHTGFLGFSYRNLLTLGAYYKPIKGYETLNSSRIRDFEFFIAVGR
jgi:hypothetical protein